VHSVWRFRSYVMNKEANSEKGKNEKDRRLEDKGEDNSKTKWSDFNESRLPQS
jgi:hypothetical protein